METQEAPTNNPASEQSYSITKDPDLKYILPVNRSGAAIAAGYLGLFNLSIFLGIFTAIPAIVLGILGLRNIKQHPGRMGKGRAWFGIISGIFSLLIIAAIWIFNGA